MSDRTMTCHEECVYTDEYHVTSFYCCLGEPSAESKAFICAVLPENTFELPPNMVAEENKGRIRLMIEHLLVPVRNILLHGSRNSAEVRQYAHDSSPAVIYKSYGSSIQPMIWNPEKLYRSRDRQR